MYDILISSIPYIAYTAPSAAPALLKGHLKSQGFECLAVDLNIEFRNQVNNNEVLGELISYWTSSGSFKLSDTSDKIYQTLLTEVAKKFDATQSKWVGFSVFSHHSRRFLLDFLPIFESFNQKKKRIVVGGHGLDIIYVDTIRDMIDFYILGEGDLALVELLKGNVNYPGINSPGVQIDNLDQIGFPDYSDYNLTDNYQNWYDGPMIQVTGSRGCVRDCSFCDVGSIWTKFRYRSGDLIAREIIQNHEKTGIKHFYFTDSLINGSVKELIKMMTVLTEYKQKTGSPLTWGGQWIVRSQKGLPKNYYSLIKSSGGFNLTIGVESGSESVRQHMKKGFTNQDLNEEMEQFSRHGVKVGFFIMLGYPTETIDDFKDTLRMFKRFTKYVANNTIMGICVGGGYWPMAKVSPELADNLSFLPGNRWKWISKATKANFLENIRRRIIAQKVLDQCRWPSSDFEFEIRPLLQESKYLFDDETKAHLDNLLDTKSVDVDDEFMIESSPHEYKIEITLVGNPGHNYPEVLIEINDRVYDNVTLVGEQTFCYTVTDCVIDNKIKISLNNKINETVVDEHGKILKDMSVYLKEVVVHDVRLDNLFLQMNGVVQTSNSTNHYDSLYSNGSYILEFKNPILDYFCDYYQRRAFFDHSGEQNLLNKLSDLFTHFVNR